MKKRNIAIAIGGGLGAAVAVKMLTRAKTVDWARVSKLVPHSDRSHFVNVDGIRIHFQEFGDPSKPSIVLIHGYTASLYVWHKMAPLLADEGFHVVALDLVGFGYTSKPRWFEYTIGAQARIVSRFMQRHGIGRATLVGSSYGGAVALTLALDYAASVEKLVLLNAVCNDEVLQHPILRMVAVPGVGEALAPFLVDSRRLLRRRMRETLSRANHDLITDDRVANVLRPLMAADAHHSLLATSRNWRACRLEQDAHLVEQPTLILWGEDDKAVAIHNGYSLHDKILNSRFIILRDCGHVPAEEKSEVVADLVTKFCHDKKGEIKDRASDFARLDA